MAEIGVKFERFEHKWAGYRAIMTSSEVRSLLEGKGQRVRQVIEPEISVNEWDVVVSPRVGRTRARVMVSGVPLWLEKKRGLLGSGIDAARSG